jgi:hypothetical protein
MCGRYAWNKWEGEDQRKQCSLCSESANLKKNSSTLLPYYGTSTGSSKARHTTGGAPQ